MFAIDRGASHDATDLFSADLIAYGSLQKICIL